MGILAWQREPVLVPVIADMRSSKREIHGPMAVDQPATVLGRMVCMLHQMADDLAPTLKVVRVASVTSVDSSVGRLVRPA